MARKQTTLAVVEDAALDVESRVTDDNHASLKLWLRMLSCTTMIETEIRSRLRREFGITLPRFDLMAQLDRHPQGLRMGDLSKRLMVTGGNVTGIVNLLEQEGLVARDAVPGDGRAFSVKLTPAGRRAFKRMATAHEGWVEELMSALSTTERTALMELLSTMKRGLNAPEQVQD
ncbi:MULTISPECIES: MarR family winged helix-turn-helix transcriptional regulator [unclassified Massilia]|uniref:MarR family winged helix-turn-helix transcriptional regulator n=1 Tax=unclassified Massilia TaxID=2609279 RepID=UPI001782A014|nr:MULTISPECIES: MarR family transcriptional regulator [unclassified Massilia]MBD8529300.1 MarR family transcriptional regulator [Massilia sp. CFBP 13647]MBD8672694.1 MarR family transcriptional regulator [Massilia sp. CFBP 13721]